MIGLIGRKVGTTQVFDEKGDVIPVTLVKIGPCYVTQKKLKDKDGYDAVQLGFEEKKRANKPTVAHFKKSGVSSK